VGYSELLSSYLSVLADMINLLQAGVLPLLQLNRQNGSQRDTCSPPQLAKR
jgi:hypothetical protein